MKYIQLGKSGLTVPSVALGCMRIRDVSAKKAEELVATALELGCNFFEHADIYGQGTCEEAFADAIHMSPSVRDKILLQSKCGIVSGVMYDFSKEHILSSVDGILKRLRTDYLDVLVLHRPDALMEPEEVAEAFDLLEGSGKVRHFGVSNHTPMQIQLLKKCVRQDLLVNQLQFSIPFSNMVASGLEANMLTDGAVNRDNSVLDFCRLHDMTIQAWSPFQYGFFEGVFVDSEKYPELNQVLADLAEKYGTTKTGIASAWIFRHPAKIQMVAGTTNLKRLREIALAADIRLTREEWYQLYLSAGHILP